MKLLETTDTTYRLEDGDGKVLEYPRVTAILSVVQDFSTISPERLAHAAERGKAVHRAIWLLEGGGDGSGLALGSLHPDLVPYIDGYLQYKKATGFEVIERERLVVSNRYHHAGRLDLLVGGLTSLSSLDLIEIKTGQEDASHELQAAAYVEAWKEMTGSKRFIPRWRLYLRPNGSAMPLRCENKVADDLRYFLAIQQTYLWIVAHRLKIVRGG